MLLLFLLLALLVFGVGAFLKALWIGAIIAVVLVAIGFLGGRTRGY